MRPIDADALLVVPNVRKVTEYDEIGCDLTYNAVPVDVIEEAPTIEPEPSEWLSMVKPETVVWRECKACGAEVEGPAFPFCPYCGKPMRNGVRPHE